MSFWNVELITKERIGFIPFLGSDPVIFEGELYFNDTKPDGTMIKLTDPSKLQGCGWKHSTELEDGITSIYDSYLTKNND